MRLRLRIVVISIVFSGTLRSFSSFGQDILNDPVVQSEFQEKYYEMVEDLAMTDSVQIAFLEIYAEYGLFMKQAYENRIGWLRLYQEYEWASRERDTKMKMILDNAQFNCFVRHQNEIEQEARKNR